MNEKITEWNKVHYCDCMDPDIGLPSLPDKSIDLGYTDPPWGVNYHKHKKVIKHGKILKKDPNKMTYNDEWDEEFTLNWFNELNRVCKRIIIITGQWHLRFWFNLEPTGMFIVYSKNSVARDSKIASWNHYTPYLYWGKFKKKLIRNVLEYVIPWGFLSKNVKWIHPSPKGLKLVLQIIGKLEPESLIDPFAGSGSFLKAADILGIPWLGYEINEVYKQDIDKRFAQKQIDLWNY